MWKICFSLEKKNSVCDTLSSQNHPTNVHHWNTYCSGNRFERCSSDVGFLNYSRHFSTFLFFPFVEEEKRQMTNKIWLAISVWKRLMCWRSNVMLFMLQIENTHSKVGDNFQVSNFESFIKAFIWHLHGCNQVQLSSVRTQKNGR